MDPGQAARVGSVVLALTAVGMGIKAVAHWGDGRGALGRVLDLGAMLVVAVAAVVVWRPRRW